MVDIKMKRAKELLSDRFRTIHRDGTVAQALDILRGAGRPELWAYIYVLDEHEALIGMIPLGDLITSDPGETIAGNVQKVVMVQPMDSQEKIARLIFKYKLEAVPVVDEDHRILGIVTARQALDYLLPETWRSRSNNDES